MNLEELFEDGHVWIASPKDGHSLSPRLSAVLDFKETYPAQSKITSSIPFGIKEFDDALAHHGLLTKAIHEIFSSDIPLSLVSFLAAQSTFQKAGYLFWIGKECWPTPHFIRQFISSAHEDEFFEKCLFIDPPSEKLKLWAFEAALRSSAVSFVFTKFKGLSFSLTRRFALAAKKGRALGIIARPIAEQKTPSAAATRWYISSAKGIDSPRFKLQLLKQKGGMASEYSWICELRQCELMQNGAKVSFGIPSELVSRFDQEEALLLKRTA